MSTTPCAIERRETSQNGLLVLCAFGRACGEPSMSGEGGGGGGSSNSSAVQCLASMIAVQYP